VRFIYFITWEKAQVLIARLLQAKPLCASPANAQDLETAKQNSSRAFAYFFCSFSNWFTIAWGR
jgi:hypothetical protein